ncbi:hypothetical protein HY213_05300 [Candidatus Peregrinibacteria bacterium]|nr:hypothetical protein [Candidatus Peregrinibacteria bacterium]
MNEKKEDSPVDYEKLVREYAQAIKQCNIGTPMEWFLREIFSEELAGMPVEDTSVLPIRLFFREKLTDIRIPLTWFGDTGAMHATSEYERLQKLEDGDTDVLDDD